MTTQTREVLDSTTDTLARLDQAVGVWEAAPTLTDDWQPGDPIYEDPRTLTGDRCPCCSPDYVGVQAARPMIQLLDETVKSHPLRCRACQVWWAGPEACWMCGDPDTARRSTPWPTIECRIAPASTPPPTRIEPIQVYADDQPRSRDELGAIAAWMLAGQIRAGAISLTPDGITLTANPIVNTVTIFGPVNLRVTVTDEEWHGRIRAEAITYARNHPRPLSIDGHAYHSRRRARARRRNRR